MKKHWRPILRAIPTGAYGGLTLFDASQGRAWQALIGGFLLGIIIPKEWKRLRK